MPAAENIPVLTQVLSHDERTASTSPSTRSMIEEGLTFTGNITLQHTCTITGVLRGHVREQAEANAQVIVSESGCVDGDITASKVTIMGHCNGTIDASGGSVDLHAKSVVNGHIRYGQLQVNGADLNATLERVAAKKTSDSH